VSYLSQGDDAMSVAAPVSMPDPKSGADSSVVYALGGVIALGLAVVVAERWSRSITRSTRRGR